MLVKNAPRKGQQGTNKVHLKNRSNTGGNARDYNFYYQIKWKYGLEREEYDKLVEDCRGSCEVCNHTPTGEGKDYLCVDHGHHTNEVRGMLCSGCNLALGQVGDSVETLENLIKYLEKA